MWRLAILLILWCGLAIYGTHHGSHIQTADRSSVDPNWSELNPSMEKMHRAMASVESSGDSDVDFVRMMLPHHQAAIDIARAQLIYGKDPQVRGLAQEIITDQQMEIELMQLWLKRHSESSADSGRMSDAR